jgi:hypothetical protein
MYLYKGNSAVAFEIPAIFWPDLLIVPCGAFQNAWEWV